MNIIYLYIAEMLCSYIWYIAWMVYQNFKYTTYINVNITFISVFGLFQWSLQEFTWSRSSNQWNVLTIVANVDLCQAYVNCGGVRDIILFTYDHFRWGFFSVVCSPCQYDNISKEQIITMVSKKELKTQKIRAIEKSNRKGKIDTISKHIHNRSFSWLPTDIYRKNIDSCGS